MVDWLCCNVHFCIEYDVEFSIVVLRRWELEWREVILLPRFGFSWPQMVLDWISCNVTFAWAQYRIVLCSSISITSEALGVGTWRSYFFFRVTFLMASDRCGLDELQCIHSYEFNVWLSTVVSFPTFSEALKVITYIEKYFFLPRSNSHGLGWFLS